MAPPSFDAIEARAALIAACTATGLDPTGAELLRLGSNAVFRLHSEPVIGRVMRGVDRADDARREIAVSRWLMDCDVPVIRALQVPQPIVAQGRVVTLWESVSETVAYGTTGELAAILRSLHGLAPPADIALPAFDPGGRARQRIGASRTLSTADRAYLLQRLGDIEGAYAGLRFALPAGPIHGDANVGNILRGRTGTPYLADLDDFTIGPREWDLVLTAMYFERYGWHSEAEYANFCDRYGCDVMSWPGYVILADLRELLMVTWMAQKASESPALVQELRRRVTSLRTNTGRRQWQPF